MTPRCNAARSLVHAALLLTALSSGSSATNVIWIAQDPNAGNGNRWSEPLNWLPGVPSDGDDLIFGPFDPAGSSLDDIDSLSINSLAFTTDAPAYEISVIGNNQLTIAGPGIINDSPLTQTLNNFGGTRFANSAAAENLHINSFQGGVTFADTSSASTATITNDSFLGVPQFVGETRFRNSSTAASATINNAPSRGGLEPGGRLFFFDTATAANAAINNLASNSAQIKGGRTSFNGSSTAGNADIINFSGTAANAGGGLTEFFFMATGGNATIENLAGVGRPGATEFNRNSSADHATISNFASTAAGVDGGQTRFFGPSTAGNAVITNSGAGVSGAHGGSTQFASDPLFFPSGSTAGNATIFNRAGAVSGAHGGHTSFTGRSNAGAATITNSASILFSGGLGGATTFSGDASAGNATITNHGGTGAQTFAGKAFFMEHSNAGNATLIANGAGNTGGVRGEAGAIFFYDASSGGAARMVISGTNAKLDISPHNSGSVAVGSIEGDGGAVFLGANNLIVGTNNLNTSFGGQIQNGGIDGGTGGSLTKVGTGTLILGNAQTFTGPTAVNAGTLIVNAGIISSPVTVNSGGTLGGNSGVFESLDIQAGGTVSPGSSIGTFSAGDTTFRPGGRYLLELRTDGTGNSGADWDLLGILGALDLSSLTSNDRFVLALQTLDAANNPNPLGTSGSTRNFSPSIPAGSSIRSAAHSAYLRMGTISTCDTRPGR
jgi:autotransporter-associated beta strand protein